MTETVRFRSAVEPHSGGRLALSASRAVLRAAGVGVCDPIEGELSRANE